jgi:hypothetical protein
MTTRPLPRAQRPPPVRGSPPIRMTRPLTHMWLPLSDGELPEPEPLTQESRKQARQYLDAFGERLTACLFSKVPPPACGQSRDADRGRTGVGAA